MGGPVAFVLKGYPRLSESFIAQEIRGLERRGLDIQIYSLRRPTDPATHPVHDEITAPVTYLPEYLGDDPARVWRAWLALRGRPGYRAAHRMWRADLARDRSSNRVRRFGQALVLAHELAPEIERLHAHFLHTPASVARYAARLSGRPWSCSAHAKDIWTTPDWEIREKLADLDWLVTCTGFGATHLAALAPDPAKVRLVYHGLDFDRFPAPPARFGGRDGCNPDDPAVVLSVGRAVAKKGYDTLLRALAALPADLAWRFVHVGDGELLAALKAQAADLGIAARIDWRGPQAQDSVLDAYRQADLFVLASRIADDGDRDGLPNVLMEAQSQNLACLGSDVAAIPELIEDGSDGLLVAPDDVAALTNGLIRLIREPALREHLAAKAQRRLRDRFSCETGCDQLAAQFNLPGGESGCASHSMRR
ncbi:MAG: glycosyltransferase family 4 protein [Alphaproteobacteria bacterium]|nr:glycosyltransferase family 4 protein [Alphaproteobacteria bacterium]